MPTYYISPTGNDPTGTGTSANPWKTLTKANASSTIGDIIIIKNGTYDTGSPSFLGNSDYTYADGRTYRGETVGSVIFDGKYTSTKPWASMYHLLPTTTDITIENIKYIDAYGDGSTNGSSGALFPINTTSPTAKVIFKNCNFAPSIDGAVNDNRSGGVFGLRTNQGTYMKFRFENCLFDNCKANGMFAYNGLQAVIGHYEFVHCTHIRKTITHPPFRYRLSGTEFNLYMRNTLWWNNTGSSITVYSVAGGDVANIDVANNWVYGAFTYGAGITSFGAIGTSDPLMVDPANSNYSLRPSSPLIGTGVIL